MAKYLDNSGLSYLWGKIKTNFAAKSHNHAADDITSGTLGVARGGTGFVGSASYDVKSLITQSSTASGNFTIDSATLAVWGMVAQLRVAFKIKASLSSNTEYLLGTLNSAIRPQASANAGVGDRRVFATCESAGGLYIRPEASMSASTSTTYYFQTTYILDNSYTG